MTAPSSVISEALAAAEARADRAERLIAEVRRDKSIFLSAVDHEFRQAMTGVLATAELLSRGCLSGENAALLSALQASAAAAQQLVDDALALAQPVEDDTPAIADTFQPFQLLDAVETLVSPLARERGVRLVMSHDGDPEIRLLGDCPRLVRALRSVVEHAVERSAGRVVEVRLSAARSQDGGVVDARVRDGGEAMNEAALAHLFEPNGSPGCGGLRLALARRLIQGAGGAVWAESNAGSGLTLGFGVALPLAVAEVAQETAPLESLGAPRVLVVDDNATNRMVATAFCEMAGCLCESAGDGVEALEAVKARAFDLILMDIRMPRMDGVAATRAIRALPGPERAIPILALTADADGDAVRTYRAAGMQDVIEKPIKPEALLTAIQAALAPVDADEAVRSVAA